ncbi:MAG: tetratricopeptide repeat protein [Spirochaetota bacterium]
MRSYLVLILLPLSLAAQTYDEVKNLTKAGIAAYHQKRFAEAKDSLSAALDIDSTWVPTVLHHGLAYADWLTTQIHIRNTRKLIVFEKYERADRELDEAEALYPEHPEIPPLRDLIRQKRSDNTKVILQKLPEKKRKDYEESMQKAQAAMDAGKYPEAMHHYSNALKVAPDSLDAKMGYAEAERMLKQQGSAQKLTALFRQAEKYEKERRFAQAVSVYDQILRIEPQNRQAIERRAALIDFMQQQLGKNERRNLAKEYLQSGNESFRKAEYDQAIDQYRIGQALDPKLADWDALIKKAIAARRAQEENLFAEKLKELERRYQSAMVQLLLENYPAAIEDLEAVIAIAQQFKQAETQKQAEALLQKAKEAMLRQDEEFITRDSPYYAFVQSLTTLGLTSYRQRDCQSTLKHFGAITEVFPKNRLSNQHILSCTIFLNPERKDGIVRDLIDGIYRLKDVNAYEARRLFEILKFIDPQNPAIAQLEKELAEKTTLLKKAVQPAEYIEALYKKALVLSQTDPEGALGVLRQLLEEDPQNTRARALLARIEGRLNRERWAQSDIPVAPAALRAYADGIVFYNTGQIAEAKAAFAQALNLAPNFDRAAVALRKCESYSKGARF